jgi:CRISPR-associated endonuclease/helicase Cas3
LDGLSNYRHEYGSLIDIVQHDPDFAKLSEDAKDLALHLIAAHHGRGRPGFPAEECFDPERPELIATAVSREVPLRYGRLQRRFGRWGLAWLESLVRASDYLASDSTTGDLS